jgi:LPPG:FO 2-phospho-L-lactate transferase
MNFTVLSGGVGGAKFSDGMAQSVGADHLTVIVNVGDDFNLYGWHISPDIDTVMYTLSGLSNPDTGWGLKGDSFQNFEMLKRYCVDPWFRIGDRDAATHMLRTELLGVGVPLSEVTQKLAQCLGVEAAIVPVTDDKLQTIVQTTEGTLAFQQYFVKHHCEPIVRGLIFDGAETAQPNARALRAIDTADTVVIAPSNPYLSLEPILAVRGVRDALYNASAPIIAVTPIIAGEAVKGPAAKMMRELELDPSALTIAQHYSEFINGFVLDERDAALKPQIEDLGIGVYVTDTLMIDRDDRARLACEVVNFADELRPEKLGGCKLD